MIDSTDVWSNKYVNTGGFGSSGLHALQQAYDSMRVSVPRGPDVIIASTTTYVYIALGCLERTATGMEWGRAVFKNKRSQEVKAEYIALHKAEAKRRERRRRQKVRRAKRGIRR